MDILISISNTSGSNARWKCHCLLNANESEVLGDLIGFVLSHFNHCRIVSFVWSSLCRHGLCLDAVNML